MDRMGLSPGMSFFTRTNSIGFDIAGIGGTRNLPIREFCRFIRQDLKIPGDQIRGVQVHPIAPFCFIGFNTEAQMNAAYTNIQYGTQWKDKGIVYPFLCQERYDEVTVYCGYDVDDDQVKDTMSRFGEVFSVRAIKLKIFEMGDEDGFSTGQYKIRMRMDRPVPQFIPVENQGDIWRTSYEGQEACCWRCFAPGHRTRECNNSKSSFSRDQRIHCDAFYRNLAQEEEQQDGDEADDDQQDDDDEEEEDGQGPQAALPPGDGHSSQDNLPPGDGSADGGDGAADRDDGGAPGGQSRDADVFNPTQGNTQECLSALENAEVASALDPEKSKRKASASVSPRRAAKTLVNAPLGDMADRRNSITLPRNPPKMMTPADRIKLGLAPTRQSRKNKTGKNGNKDDDKDNE